LIVEAFMRARVSRQGIEEGLDGVAVDLG